MYDFLAEEVSRAETTHVSAIDLIKKLAEALEKNKNKAGAIQGIADQPKASTEALEKAIEDAKKR